MPQEITPLQKVLLETIAGTCGHMETTNDLQYALKGLLTEVSHIATGEYYDSAYVCQKARIIFDALIPQERIVK